MSPELVGEQTRGCHASGLGPAGIVARLTVGLTLLALGALWRTPAGGCEVTAIANALLRRDDQVGCPLFAPVDLVEQRAQR
jgi:hypothetical protein